jgi:hypothetical protein
MANHATGPVGVTPELIEDANNYPAIGGRGLPRRRVGGGLAPAADDQDGE